MNNLVSIIIPVRFRADLTEACLDSIVKYTDNFELILVQEGLDDELTKLLKSYNAKFIQNKIPKGFAGAMNTGLSLARGNYYCFLNNDTVVIRNWLDEMMKAFEDTEVGLVSPTYNAVHTIQSVNYNKGQYFDYIEDPLMLFGTCFLLKKTAMDKIGKWDEKIGMGGGEDNDLCVRVLKAGYKMVVARKSFIYHYGCASFRELYNNDIKIIETKSKEEFEKFQKKYNYEFIAKPTDKLIIKINKDNRIVKII